MSVIYDIVIYKLLLKHALPRSRACIVKEEMTMASCMNARRLHCHNKVAWGCQALVKSRDFREARKAEDVAVVERVSRDAT